jgi:hypothetical protein
MKNKYLNETERKQRLINIYNGFTFEHTADLSGEVIIHPPNEYTEEMLSIAITQFIGMFMVTTFEKLNGFSGFGNINYKIMK